MQRASLCESQPFAKLEAILRCLMTKGLGGNIDHTVLSTEHVQQLGSKKSVMRSRYWTTGHEMKTKASIKAGNYLE